MKRNALLTDDITKNNRFYESKIVPLQVFSIMIYCFCLIFLHLTTGQAFRPKLGQNYIILKNRPTFCEYFKITNLTTKPPPVD